MNCVVRVLSHARPLVFLATIAAFAAVGAVWGKVALEIKNAAPIPDATRPTAIVWDDRVFSSPAQLGSWLRSRGETYTGWAHSHPASAAVLEHRPAPAQRVETVQTAPAVAQPQRTPATRHATQGGQGARIGSILATIVRWLVLLGCLLVAAAFVCAAALPPAFRIRFPRGAAAAAPHRELLFASGLALVLGVIVGVALS
jgi:hypothetical protein